MTTSVKVSVSGDKRVLVTQGASSSYVSGKGVSGAKEVEYHLSGPDETLTIGAEEDDNGVDGESLA